MATITITNAAKVVIPNTCLKYTFQHRPEWEVSSPSIVRYTNCDGIIKTVDVSIAMEGEIAGPVTICALNIIDVGGQVEDITDYGNQQSCGEPPTLIIETIT